MGEALYAIGQHIFSSDIANEVAAERWLKKKTGLASKTIKGYKERTAPLVVEFGQMLRNTE